MSQLCKEIISVGRISDEHLATLTPLQCGCNFFQFVFSLVPTHQKNRFRSLGSHPTNLLILVVTGILAGEGSIPINYIHTYILLPHYFSHLPVLVAPTFGFLHPRPCRLHCRKYRRGIKSHHALLLWRWYGWHKVLLFWTMCGYGAWKNAMCIFFSCLVFVVAWENISGWGELFPDWFLGVANIMWTSLVWFLPGSIRTNFLDQSSFRYPTWDPVNRMVSLKQIHGMKCKTLRLRDLSFFWLGRFILEQPPEGVS